MSEWIVYSKDGLTERCRVKDFEYNGEFLGSCSINMTITSQTPIAFEIGDFLEYRGERFEINYDPSVIKQSSRDTHGEGFKYENVVFNSLSDELTRCDFLDYVPSDNQIHYTSLPTFSFFADNIGKLAERIQVNLDRIYKDDKKWTIIVHEEYVNKTNVNITANNITCWDALAFVKSEFDANFIIKGRTITIGTEGIAIGKIFSYGKGNGLISIERSAESEQKIITRLRAYGSTKNMPESYYKNLGMKVFFKIGEYSVIDQSATFHIGTKYNSLNLFTDVWKEQNEGAYTAYKIKVRLNDVSITAQVALNEGDIESYINVSPTYEPDNAKLEAFISELNTGKYSKLYVESGVINTAFPYDEREYLENIPNNMAVRNLMLPSFPENQDPYIDSKNIDELGVREGTVFFDGSDGLEEIYPTLPSENGINQIRNAQQIEDDGVFPEGSTIPMFEIYLNDLGFDINDHRSTAGNPIIAMKDGMCGGREFEVQSVEFDGVGYKATCNRSYDDSLDLYFPYNSYQIKSGDRFTLLNISMPDEYVQAASERLLEAANEYLAQNDYVRYSYSPKVDNIYMARQHEESLVDGGISIYSNIKEGDLMLFEDEDLGIDGSIIIDTLSIKESEGLIPQYEITLKDEKVVGTFEKIQNQIDSIVSGSLGVKGGGYNTSQIKSIINAYGSSVFLRKDKDDRSKGTIASDKGFVVGDFKEGTLGSGASIFEREGNTYEEVDFLKVRKKATFTEITVQELKHVGGEIILSPAAMICSRVEESENGWKCYFNTEDSEGKKVYQEFVIDDLARCQTFNLSPKGANDLAGNHYYWRKVISVGEDYIELSKIECDAQSDAPQVGDNISQLGNTSDKKRQAAIILSAFGSDAPSYKQYNGIDGFSLVGKQVTKLSPYGNELTGILNIEAGSKGAGNLKDLPSEIFDAVHIGSVNLLLNSGFTGDYKAEELDASYALNSGSELFSRGMKHWAGDATINDDTASVSGKSAVIGSLSQSVQLMKGEGYVVSFKAKGVSVKVMLGGSSVEQVLGTDYTSYSFKFVSDGIGMFSISGDATICDLQLERGTIATDWHASPYDNDRTLAEFQALKYIQDAIREGDTTILGGLILSSMIQLGNYKDGKMEKVNAGMSGIYNDNDDVAFWGGGTFEQAIKTVIKFKENPLYRPTDLEWQSLANFVVTHGGDLFLRGYIHAKGGVIEHGIFKDVKSQNGSFEIDEEGNVAIVGKFETSDSGNRIIIDPNNKTISMKVTTNTKDIDVVTLSFEQVDGSYSYGSFNLTRSQIGIDEFGNEYPLPVDSVDINPTRIKLSRVNAPSLTLTNEGIIIKKGDAEMKIGLTPVYGDGGNIPSVSITGWISDLQSNAWPTNAEQVAVGGVYNDNGTLKVKS